MLVIVSNFIALGKSMNEKCYIELSVTDRPLTNKNFIYGFAVTIR